MTVSETLLAPQLTALRCAFLLAHHHGVHLPPEGLPAIDQSDMAAPLRRSLEQAGFRVRVLTNGNWARAAALGTAAPALALMKDGSWIVLVHAGPAEGGDAAAILDPQREAHGVHALPRAAFLAKWSGTLLLARKAPRLTDENQPFGLRWFIPELLKQRSLLAGVGLAAIVSNLIAIAFPLLLQVLIDRVVCWPCSTPPSSSSANA